MLRLPLSILSASAVLLLSACAAPLPAALDAPILPENWRNDPSPGRDTALYSTPDNAQARLQDTALGSTPYDAHIRLQDMALGSTAQRPEASPSGALPDNASWWKALNSDVLNSLVEQALVNNHDIQAAGHRLASAHVSNSNAWTAFWPDASLKIQGARDAAARDNYLQVGVDVLWPLALPVERQGAARLAQGQFDVARADQEIVRAAVAAEVVRSWLQAMHVARTLAIEKSALASALTSTNYLEHRVRAGLLADTAAIPARLQADERRRRIAQGTSTLHELGQTLALLVGQPTPDPDWFATVAPVATAAGATGDANTAAIDRVPSAWLAERQDVMLAHARVVQAAGQTDLAQAALYPRVMLGLSWIYAKNVTGNVRHRNESEPMVAPFVDIPLWDWGARRARRDAQANDLKAALSDYHQALLTAYAQTEVALQGVASWQQVRVASKTSLDDFNRLYDRAQAGARAGLIDRLEVEEARRMAQDAEIQWSASMLGEQLAFSALHRNRQVGVAQ